RERENGLPRSVKVCREACATGFGVRGNGDGAYSENLFKSRRYRMSDDPNARRERPNPSVESTKLDDANARRLHEDEGIAGAAAGAGAGCLGMALLPWV